MAPWCRAPFAVNVSNSMFQKCVETQIYDLSNQLNAVLQSIDVLHQEQSLPRSSGEGVKVGNSSASNLAKPVRDRSVGIYIKPSLTERDSVEALKPSSSKPSKPISEDRTEQPMHTVPDNEHKPARGQIKGPHDYSSAAQSAVASTLTSTRDPGRGPQYYLSGLFY